MRGFGRQGGIGTGTTAFSCCQGRPGTGWRGSRKRAGGVSCPAIRDRLRLPSPACKFASGQGRGPGPDTSERSDLANGLWAACCGSLRASLRRCRKKPCPIAYETGQSGCLRTRATDAREWRMQMRTREECLLALDGAAEALSDLPVPGLGVAWRSCARTPPGMGCFRSWSFDCGMAPFMLASVDSPPSGRAQRAKAPALPRRNQQRRSNHGAVPMALPEAGQRLGGGRGEAA
jgi:hypothetical protein